MAFLDDLKEMVTGATTKLWYGVSPEEKQGMMYSRSLPGAPSYLDDPEESERYASTYLGAKKWGRLPAEVFNSIALSDIFEKPTRAARRKMIGSMGAEAGSREQSTR